MKYFAIAVILTAIAGLVQGGLNCWVCEDGEGRRAVCDGNNEKDKECGDQVIGWVLHLLSKKLITNLSKWNPLATGCVEEVTLNKETSESRTQRFCMDPSSPHNKSAIFSYFAPMVADRNGKFISCFVHRIGNWICSNWLKFISLSWWVYP